MLNSNPSSYGRQTSGLDSNKLTRSIENFLNDVKNLENSPVKPVETAKLPAVVSRLVDKEGKYYRRRKTLPVQPRSTPKAPQVRTVKKQITSLDQNPGAAHYNPNFNAVLANEPVVSMPRAFETPDKSNLDNVPMGEMLKNFSSHIRAVEFEQPETRNIDLKPLEPSCVENQKTYIIPTKLDVKRDSYIVGESTPGPSAYNTVTKKKVKDVIPFQCQVSREDIGEHFEKPIRDTRSAIDATKKREPRPIPFDKQESREKKAKKEDSIWKEIEEEQKRLIEQQIEIEQKRKEKRLAEKSTKERSLKKKKVQPMSRGGRDERGPFAHLMRKEVEPLVPYEVDRTYKYLERPKTAFDIKQKSFKEDRQIYVKTEAPDKLYDNVVDEWKNTKPKENVPNFDALHYRYDAYHYMPKTCGEDDKRSRAEIDAEKRELTLRTMPPTSTRKGKPKALKRIIDTPLSIKRFTSDLDHRYADKFG